MKKMAVDNYIFIYRTSSPTAQAGENGYLINLYTYLNGAQDAGEILERTPKNISLTAGKLMDKSLLNSIFRGDKNIEKICEGLFSENQNCLCPIRIKVAEGKSESIKAGLEKRYSRSGWLFEAYTNKRDKRDYPQDKKSKSSL